MLATIGLLAAAHILMALAPQSVAIGLEWAYGLSPLKLREGLAAGRLSALAPLATYMLLHGGFRHLLLNLVWLLPLGAAVARRLGADEYRWGGARAVGLFISFYACSGVAGGLLYALFNSASATPAVGASGAVFGLLGAVARFWRGGEIARGPSSAPIVPLNDRFLLMFSGANILLNLLIGLLPQAFGFPRVAWEAHVGGYVFGLLAFPIFARAAAR